MVIMKIKDGFMTRNISGKIVAVAVGDRALEFNGMINLNETGEFIWKCLEEDTTIDEVATKVAHKYDIAIDEAKQSVLEFVKQLDAEDLLQK
jgi:hypothetical protein